MENPISRFLFMKVLPGDCGIPSCSLMPSIYWWNSRISMWMLS